MSAVHPLWLPLGELLVDRGLLSQRQLELALMEHGRTGRRLGEVLVELGFVSQQALTATLLEQVGLSETAPTPDVEAPAEHHVEAQATPVIVRFDAEHEQERRRWWSRGAGEERVAELERVLKDFERRSREIQTNIAEIRATLRELHES